MTTSGAHPMKCLAANSNPLIRKSFPLSHGNIHAEPGPGHNDIQRVPVLEGILGAIGNITDNWFGEF